MRTPTIPKDRSYAKTHEWVKVNEGVALIGITRPALKQLGKLIAVELPTPDDEMMRGVPLGCVEGVDGIHELLPPADCLVLDVNEAALWDFDALGEDPYEDGWLVRIEVQVPEHLEGLMDADAYAARCKELWGRDYRVG